MIGDDDVDLVYGIRQSITGLSGFSFTDMSDEMPKRSTSVSLATRTSSTATMGLVST